MDAGTPYKDQGRLAAKQLPMALLVGGLLAFASSWIVVWLFELWGNDIWHMFVVFVFLVPLLASNAITVSIAGIHRPVVAGLSSLWCTAAGCYGFLIFWVQGRHADGAYFWSPQALREGLDTVYAAGVEHTISVSRVLETGTHIDYQLDTSGWLMGTGFLGLVGMAVSWQLVRDAFHCNQCSAEMTLESRLWSEVLPNDPDATLEALCHGQADAWQGWQPEEADEARTRLEHYRCPQHEECGVIVLNRLKEYVDKKEIGEKRIGRPLWLGAAALEKFAKARPDES